MTASVESQKRRTFAIISHPDAGKTTLTEKFLLYGGALNTEAGSVKGKAGGRSATSDWMALEQQRGIGHRRAGDIRRLRDIQREDVLAQQILLAFVNVVGLSAACAW